MPLKKKTRTRSILRRTPKSRQYLVELAVEVAESKKSPLNTIYEEGWDKSSTVKVEAS